MGQPAPRDPSMSAESLLAAIVASSHDAIISLTLDGVITTWNPAAAQLFGYPAEDAIGQPFALLVPGDRQGEFARVLERLKQGEAITDEVAERVRKDGSRVVVSLGLSPVRDADGHLVGAAMVCRDLTETRALRQAETRYRTLVERLPAVVSLNAPDATQSTLYASPASEGVFGYTPEEYLADPTLWMQILHPDDRERVLADLECMNATGKAVQDEYRMLARDGRVVWVLEDSLLIRDVDGQPLYWQTVQLDVTARKQAEDALRQSEERFHTAFDSAAIGMALVDLDGHCLQANASLCLLTGYTEAELLASTLRVQDLTHPDDLTKDLEQVHRLLAGELRAYEMDKRFIHQTGEIVWGHLSCALVRDQQGEPLHFIAQVEDITARKAAEAALQEAETKYRTLVEQLPAVVYIVANDALYTPLFYNSYIEIMTGETPEEAMARTGYWLEDIHPEDQAHVGAAETQAASTGEVFQVEYRRRRRDGSYCWVRNEASPLLNEAGQIVAWQGVMLDITDRKQAEEDLRAALAVAQAANQAKGAFLDLMSHELRTPLQATLGYSEFLLAGQGGSLTAEQREDIDVIHQASVRMLTLINHLLELSRTDAGHLHLACEPVDLDQVMAQVRQEVAPQAAEKGLTLDIGVPASLPPVKGDAQGVRQVLLNLVSNAVKFTPTGTVRVLAAMTATGVMEIVVGDTGLGISPEALPHIFEEFYQENHRLRHPHGGTGLGLAIAHKVATQMGGSITVTSEPDVGSTFRVYLPLWSS